MKKAITLLVGAVVAQGFAANAMAEGPIDGKVYGKLNTAVIMEDDSTTEDVSLGNYSSRLGFKGKTELSDGLYAVYKLEYGVDPDEKAEDEGNHQIFKQRNSYVGLSHKSYGTIIAGTHDTPLKKVQGNIDMFDRLPNGDFKNVIVGQERINDLVHYTSPKMAGFSVKAATQVQEAGDPDDASSVSVTYDKGAIFAGIGIDQEQMQQNYIQAVIQEKVNPAGTPYFEPKNMKRGEDLEFIATFEIFPEVEVQSVEEIEIERPVAEVTDADLDNMMETLRKQQAEWVESSDAAAEGSRVNINFVGKVDGEEFEGGKAENFELDLGAGRMIPGFEKEVTGMKVGEEKTIQVTFPEDYHAENLKGKDAEFDIKVHKTEGPVLPSVDEEFAKLFGIEDGGVEALREEVGKNMSRELSQAVKAKVKEQVIEGLLEAHELDLPAALVAQEVDVLRQQAMQRFAGQMDPKNLPELPSDMFEEQAKRRVKVGLLLGEVIKVNELKVDEDKVKELIATAASAYEDPQEVIDYYNSNQEMHQQMQNVALEEQAVELLVEKAKVKDKKASFKDIMNPEAK